MHCLQIYVLWVLPEERRIHLCSYTAMHLGDHFWFKLGEPLDSGGVHEMFFEKVHSLLAFGAFGLQGIVGSLTTRPPFPRAMRKSHFFGYIAG